MWGSVPRCGFAQNLCSVDLYTYNCVRARAGSDAGVSDKLIYLNKGQTGDGER